MARHPDQTHPRPGDAGRIQPKRRYVPPRLEVVRALQEVVLGSSPGFGDSGGGSMMELPPGGGP